MSESKLISLDNNKLFDAVVENVAQQFVANEDNLYNEVEKRVSNRIDSMFTKSVEPRIQAEIDKALSDAFNKEYQKTSAWGESEGRTTTISKELVSLMSKFWAEKVDEKGKESSYGKMTRAEYTMAKVLGADFKEQTEKYLVQSAAWLKDGMRDHLRGEIDKMLANLFHVRSAQDKAEGRYK